MQTAPTFGQRVTLENFSEIYMVKAVSDDGATVDLLTLSGKPCTLLLLAALVTASVTAQQLPSYIEKPADAAGVFAIYPGSGVPPGSEKWTWHEQSIQSPGNTVPNRMSGML
jgi:hypothetical protein